MTDIIPAMSRESTARILAWSFGVASVGAFACFQVAGFAVHPLDFQRQVQLSKTALAISPSAAAVIIAGLFRQERRATKTTVIWGAILLFAWIGAAIGSMPVS